MFRPFLTAALAIAFTSVSATAATITYDFNSQFSSYNNNSVSGVESGPGGILTGSLTIDPTKTGNDFIVSYNLSSFLKGYGGSIYRTSTYDSADTNQNFALNISGGTSLTLLTAIGSTLERLILDFGSAAFGDNPIMVTASETFFNCKGVFSGGYPRNSCTLPNYGVGLGTGVAGSNGGTLFSIDLNLNGGNGGSGDTGGATAVPLPAGVPLLMGGLGLLAVATRRRNAVPPSGQLRPSC